MAVEEIYLHPEDYDLELWEHGNEDVSFWVDMIARERPRRLLEIGCGTGRLTLPLARVGSAYGFDVTGIDIEPTMLQRARERAADEPERVRDVLRLLHRDVRDLRLDGERFDAVIMPYGIAHHLISREDQLSAWRALRRHMLTGSLLVVEVSAPSLESLVQATAGTPRMTDLDVRDGNGTHLVRSVSASYFPATQHAVLAFSYTVRAVNGECRCYDSPFEMYVYFPCEFTSLFADTGFAVERLIGGYNGDIPFAATSPVMIAVARAVAA
jgi:ubiquinone/menaquinone biosynthesis C-methylase UbiE